MKRLTCILLLMSGLQLLAWSQIESVPVSDRDFRTKENAMLYFLPQTGIDISIEVETEKFIPGPFCAYADKFLNLKNVKTTVDYSSQIVDIQLVTYPTADPSAAFLLFDKGKGAKVSYASGGVIKSVGCTAETTCSTRPTVMNLPHWFNDRVAFTDLSVKRNFSNITDTTYKVVEIDSVFTKIPVYHSQITSKTFEQKAEEAANFLIKIRKRRFKVVSAQFETETPPTDIDRLVTELDKIEQTYLELFIGKTETVRNKFTFNYLPKRGDGKIILCHFSDKMGISTADSNDNAMPIYLEINNLNTGYEIENMYGRQEKMEKSNKAKGLYYRIPGEATLNIVANDKVLLRQNLIIPQFGLINYLPQQLTKNKNFKIIFDENHGSIISIDMSK